ncbi:MAG: PP2C family protein-serine/threonine phosphatase [Roseburia sp.]
MRKETTSKKRRLGLKRKILISMILFTIVLCSASCRIGYNQYHRTISKLYNRSAYIVGEMILNEVDHDKIAEYATTWTEDSYYHGMADYLKRVEETSGAAYIYIVIPAEDNTMRYIYDSSGLSMGDYDPVALNYEDLTYIYESGERIEENYFVRHSEKYGYLTSAILPVKDSSGATVALLFVDFNMELIVSKLVGYVLKVLAISGVIFVVFIFCYWYFMKKWVIHPIQIIKQNAYEFEKSDAQLTDTLEQVQTGDELQDLAETISSMEHAIVRYIDHIKRVTAEKERISAELNVATQIQADMLPRIFPPFPDRKEFDIYATMTPAKEVGGDFYDFFLVDEDHLALVMADVSGKGVPAALFMVIAKTLIKNRTQMGGGPAEILGAVNEQLCEGNEAELFVTVWLAILEISSGKGVAANAGHEHPVIRRASDGFELVKYRHSPAVAAMEGIRFREHEFELHPGDCLYVYTDGVPEATNSREELFGTDRMLAALNRNPLESPEEILSAVKEEIDSFVGDAPQFDDITMLCLNYYGKDGKCQ